MKTGDTTTLYRIAEELSEIFDRDAPLTQVLAMLRVAMGGDVGVDQGRLADDLSMSTATASRCIQALSNVHYLKDRPGYGLVERIFDPTDNRRRELKLTPKGQKAVEKLSEELRKGAR